MPDTIRIDERFIKSFLVPLENISEKALLSIEDGKISSTVVSPESGIILYAETNIDTNIEEAEIGVSSVRKIRTHLEIGTDLSKSDELVLDGNKLKYDSGNWRFSLHLLDVSILTGPPFSKEKIKHFDYSHSFILNNDVVKKIVKLRSANKEAEKVYFIFDEDGVYADLTDHSTPNMDVSGLKICDKYEGDSKKIGCPILFDLIRAISRYKDVPFKVKYNGSHFIFQTIYNKVSISYIIAENTN